MDHVWRVFEGEKEFLFKNLDISVLVAARDEYIEQLKCIITPLLIQGFNSIYADAIKISNERKTIYKFQELLKFNFSSSFVCCISNRLHQL